MQTVFGSLLIILNKGSKYCYYITHEEVYYFVDIGCYWWDCRKKVFRPIEFEAQAAFG